MELRVGNRQLEETGAYWMPIGESALPWGREVEGFKLMFNFSSFYLRSPRADMFAFRTEKPSRSSMFSCCQSSRGALPGAQLVRLRGQKLAERRPDLKKQRENGLWELLRQLLMSRS